MKLRHIVPGALITLSLAACGGSNGPDIEKVRADFNHPTGSVADKSALIDATSNRNDSGIGLAIAGGGVPGRALTASGNPFAEIGPARRFGPAIQSFSRSFAANGRSVQNLDMGGLDGAYANDCASSEESTMAYTNASRNIQVSGNSAHGSASYSIDVSSCSNGKMTGTIKGTFEINVTSNGMNSGTFDIRVTEELLSVCEVGGRSACVDGTFVLDAAGMGNDGGGSFDMVEAWELSATWIDNGTKMSAETKGGIKAALSGTSMGGSADLQYLLYAKNSKGEEVSFVLTLKADSMSGKVTWSYQGSDGSIECEVNEDGSGSCSGTNGMVSWTADEYRADSMTKK